jgi:hypothetical protein
MSGNGGGYGGMVSATEQYGSGGAAAQASLPQQQSEHYSEYQGRSSSTLGHDFRHVFLHIGDRTPSCTRLAGEWRHLDAFVTGILSVNRRNAFYGAALCSRTARLRSSVVSIVDFNPQIAVFANRVFERFEENPPALADLKTTVAYCRSAIIEHSLSGADLGADVRIYRNGRGLFGELTIGKDVEGVLTRAMVRGFAVSEHAMSGGTTFTARGFELKVVNMDANPTTGSLSILLDGEQIETPLPKCWH